MVTPSSSPPHQDPRARSYLMAHAPAGALSTGGAQAPPWVGRTQKTGARLFRQFVARDGECGRRRGMGVESRRDGAPSCQSSVRGSSYAANPAARGTRSCAGGLVGRTGDHVHVTRRGDVDVRVRLVGAGEFGPWGAQETQAAADGVPAEGRDRCCGAGAQKEPRLPRGASVWLLASRRGTCGIRRHGSDGK